MGEGKAWSKIDTAATQFPIAEARRLGTVATTDFAGTRLAAAHLTGQRRGISDSYFPLFGRRRRLDSDLIF